MNTHKLHVAILCTAGALALGLLTGISSAQEAPQDQAPAAQQNAPRQRMHGRALEGLNLSADQQAQIKKIREDAKSKADALRADTSLSDADRKAKFRAIHVETRKQMMSVLTPEQRQQLKEKMKERRAARQSQQPS